MATELLIHRGPDQQGTYESPMISLGAVRLKIIDLSGGNQPMASDDGKTVLAYNGEIYNAGELRAELESRGKKFQTNSDTEVVLRSFLMWDKDCFARLRGMFAIAIWREDERRLILARDRLGIKPLYFHVREGEIYFGSELKSIFAHPEVERRLDVHALQYYLALNYVPCPRTLAEGIEKLPPGHLLEWQEGEIGVEAYWRVRFEPQSYKTLAAAEEELDALLRESLREHLISDVPLGIWLSGGVDSSTILHYAREICGSRVKTFSVSFAGRNFDESAYIREVAERYDTEHYQVDVSPALDLPSAVEELAYYSDEPCADAGAVPVWFLSALSRKHVTVALSGEGADELFGGYITYQADRYAAMAQATPRLLRRGLLSLLKYWPVSDDKISTEYKVKRFLEGSFLSGDERHAYWNGTFSAEQQRALLNFRPRAFVSDLFDMGLPAADEKGSLNRYLEFDQRYYLADDILQKVDRVSMAHSVEIRPPFLDHRIVEFAARLPERLKMSGLQHKVVLKHLMRHKLPSRVLRRPKTGLDIPTHDWLRGPLRELMMDTINVDAIDSAGVFRPEGIDRLVQDHLERRANWGYHLWGLLILFLWIKHWNIQAAAEPRRAESIRSRVVTRV